MKDRFTHGPKIASAQKKIIYAQTLSDQGNKPKIARILPLHLPYIYREKEKFLLKEPVRLAQYTYSIVNEASDIVPQITRKSP